MSKKQGEMASARDYPQGFAGTVASGGLPAPTGDTHALLRPSGVPVDNGAGMEGVWKALVDSGYAVRPAQPCQYHHVDVSELTKRE